MTAPDASADTQWGVTCTMLLPLQSRAVELEATQPAGSAGRQWS